MYYDDDDRQIKITGSIEQLWYRLYLNLQLEAPYWRVEQRIRLPKSAYKRRDVIRHALFDALPLDVSVTPREIREWYDGIDLEYMRLTQGEYDKKSVVWPQKHKIT